MDTPDETTTQVRPRIVIEFAGPDSASASVRSEHVHRGQRMVAIRILDQWDQDMHQAEVAQAMQAAAQVQQVAQAVSRNGHRGR